MDGPDGCSGCGSERQVFQRCKELQRPTQKGSWDTVFEVARFDPTLGVLEQVDIRACFVLDADICITNGPEGPCTFSITYLVDASIALQPSGGPVPGNLELTILDVLTPEASGDVFIPAGGSSDALSVERAYCTDCDPPSDRLPPGIECDDRLYAYPSPLTDQAILNWFTDGPGSADDCLEFDVTAIPIESTINACATYFPDVTIRLGALLEVAYTYCPNAPPMCADDSAEVCANVAGQPTEFVDIFVLANDVDPDGFIDCTTLTILTPPTKGTTAVMGCSPAQCNTSCPNGCRFRYTPNVGQTGCDTFSYTVMDNEGCPTTCTVRVCIHPRPIANPDCAVTCDPTPVFIDVLDNDTAPDAMQGECGCTASSLDCGSIMIVTGPPMGTATVTDCGILYTPELGTCPATVEFTYKVSSNQPGATGCPMGQNCMSNVTTVTVDVVCGPVAMNDTCELPDGAPFLDIYVLANDLPPVDGYIDCTSLCILDDCGPGAACQPVTGTWPTTQGGSVQIMGCTTPDCCGTGQCGANPCTQNTGSCFVRYFPPAGGLTTDDSFCYRICRDPMATGTTCDTTLDLECCDEATVVIRGVCPKKTHRQPSALLVYPEFDNRDGVMTIVTVTNTHTFKNAGVHFQYVEKDGCTRFDRIECLTPNDTLSLITNAHNPNEDQGYLYVYATCCPDTGNVTSEPIAFNYLIGNLLIVDGLLTISYAVNPIAFCAGPGTPTSNQCPMFAKTDVDGDGIRDLNWDEYEAAPDQILIPRFLGQDGPDAVASDIILIALSGGKAFTTQVDVLVYNDNEQPFSTQPTFKCWKKMPLIEFSPATSNNYLHNFTTDDADEILGNSDQESGWIRIDGLTASSSSTTIVDPAVYAVLVECVDGNRCVADLPFELCTQTNGDLLPATLQGDPNPGDD